MKTDPFSTETVSPAPKRYDCGNGGGLGGYCYGCYTMEESEYGDYVRWEAYEALQARAADLLALAKQVASECSGCNGAGRAHSFADNVPGDITKGIHTVEADCEDCADIRATIAKAEGQ